MATYGVLAKAALETARISVPTIVDAVLKRTDYRTCDVRLDSWSDRLVAHAQIDLETSGLQHIRQGRSYVVMSNHQSHYDIPVLFQALKIPLRMVAKKELFKIPVMGKAMIDSGFILLDRQNRRRAVAGLQVAKQRINDHGLSVWIAPEGTRSRDGALGRFRTGGFHLALETGASVLPVTINGTMNVHRAGDSVIHLGRRVQVDVHAPIRTTEFSRSSIKELMGRVRDAIESGLAPSERLEHTN